MARVVYDFYMTQAARALKIACDSRKRKSYSLNRPLEDVSVKDCLGGLGEGGGGISIISNYVELGGLEPPNQCGNKSKMAVN